MRRMMYRLAERMAQKTGCYAIANGESIGQVASQTPESISVIAKVSDTLILRPLCMMDKLEIIDIAKRIDTYETSILPYEDCCTIFTPKQPATKPKIYKVEEFEKGWDYDTMVKDCIDDIIERMDCGNNFFYFVNVFNDNDYGITFSYIKENPKAKQYFMDAVFKVIEDTANNEYDED